MEQTIGMIISFAGDFAPLNWQICNGQSLQVREYEKLFSLIGNTYGGDGYQTFNLPDLRGRVPMGVTQPPTTGTNYTLAQQGGVEKVTLTDATMPKHTHVLNIVGAKLSVRSGLSVSNSPATLTTSAGAFCKLGAGNCTSPEVPAVYNYGGATNLVEIASGTIKPQIGFPLDVSLTGNNTSHNNIQPTIALNYIICFEGLYPIRP